MVNKSVQGPILGALSQKSFMSSAQAWQDVVVVGDHFNHNSTFTNKVLTFLELHQVAHRKIDLFNEFSQLD